MLKIGIMVLLVFVWAPVSMAFDFFGIQSGMTHQQVLELFAKRHHALSVIYAGDIRSYEPMRHSAYERLAFEFTAEQILWRLDAWIPIPKTYLQKKAMEAALAEKYPQADIEVITERKSQGRSEFYVLKLYDKQVAQKAISKLKADLLDQL